MLKCPGGCHAVPDVSPRVRGVSIKCYKTVTTSGMHNSLSEIICEVGFLKKSPAAPIISHKSNVMFSNRNSFVSSKCRTYYCTVEIKLKQEILSGNKTQTGNTGYGNLRNYAHDFFN